MANLAFEAPRDRGKGGKENVLVCVRVRPPAAKLAKASAAIEEVAWDVSELEGRLSLKAGGPEFLFGSLFSSVPTSRKMAYRFPLITDSVVTGSENYDVYQEAGKDLVL